MRLITLKFIKIFKQVKEKFVHNRALNQQPEVHTFLPKQRENSTGKPTPHQNGHHQPDRAGGVPEVRYDQSGHPDKQPRVEACDKEADVLHQHGDEAKEHPSSQRHTSVASCW